MLQQQMLTAKTRASLAWSCLTRLVLTYGHNEEVSERLWSWVTYHFSQRWEHCAQQLPFCMTLAIKRHTENGAPPSVLVLERSFLSSFLWQTDVRASSSLPVWTVPTSISRAIPYHKDPQRDSSPRPYPGRNNTLLQVDHFKGSETGEGHIFFCELWSRGKGGALTVLQKWLLSHVKRNRVDRELPWQWDTIKKEPWPSGLKAALAAVSRNLCFMRGLQHLDTLPHGTGVQNGYRLSDLWPANESAVTAAHLSCGSVNLPC